VTCIQLW